eukprot:gene8888-11987_t
MEPINLELQQSYVPAFVGSENNIDIEVICTADGKRAKIESNETAASLNPINVDDTLIADYIDSSNCLLSNSDVSYAKNDATVGKWTQKDGIIFKLSNGLVHTNSTEMIAFDMDGTLIKTKSGKAFSINESDWELWHSSISVKLLQLYNEGKYLAIISNQSGIKSNHITPEALQRKVDKLIAVLGVPIDFICSIDNDIYRKPRVGMWEFLVFSRCKNCLISKSLYVGDAAGRVKEGTRKKDHSDSDLKLALNLRVKFQTPERFFFNSNQSLHKNVKIESGIILSKMPTFDPPDVNMFMPPQPSSSSQPNDLVILVAPAACGKSTLSRRFVENGYVRVNQDTLKTFEKCLETAKKYLNQNRSVCVDNTNMKRDVRKTWIDVAKQCNVKIRCVVLDTSKEICSHLAAFRLLDTMTSVEDRREINKILINTFFKNPDYPAADEGFDELHTLHWSPVIPVGRRSQKLFDMYLI